jgi:tetratricopeptide (TPR) repeat protein
MTELEPGNAFGYISIGNVYLQEGKYAEAIPSYQKALALQPHSATYTNLGTAYFFLKRYSDAVPMYEKAVEMDPNDETLAGNLADAYRWSGQRDKANATYDKAIALGYKALEVNPRSAETMGSLALRAVLCEEGRRVTPRTPSISSVVPVRLNRIGSSSSIMVRLSKF